MPHFYPPPNPFIGGHQPLDPFKGTNPAILNNPVSQGGGWNSNDAVFKPIFDQWWNQPPPRPPTAPLLNAALLNNTVTFYQGQTQLFYINLSVITQQWQPLWTGPPRPLNAPFNLPPVNNPPGYTRVSLSDRLVRAWTLDWGPQKAPNFTVARTVVAPPTGKRHHTWQVGSGGISSEVQDVRKVDKDPPTE